jgi:hypothetical protein
MSLLVWFAAAVAVMTLAGSPPFQEPLFAPLLFFAALVLYAYEMRGCQTLSTIVWPRDQGSSQAFAARVQSLRNAAPRVSLIAPGAAPVNYQIAEWRDETRSADPEGFAGAPRGLFLVTFPVEIFPGDPSEASALEFAQVQLAKSAAGNMTPSDKVVDECGPLCEEADKVDCRCSLQWQDGFEGLPSTQVLAEGSEADCLRPLLVIASVCLFGLVVDVLLNALLAPLVWPIRKRIFTVQGYFLGAIRFSINKMGEVHLDGDEEELKAVNKFWLKHQDWKVLWSAVQEAARRSTRLRRIRLGTCYAAAFAAVSTLAAASLAWCSGRPNIACATLGSGSMLALLLFASAGLAGYLEHRSAQCCAEDLTHQLHGTASCKASWPNEGPYMLSIEVEQLANERSKQASRMPISSSSKASRMPVSSSSKDHKNVACSAAQD